MGNGEDDIVTALRRSEPPPNRPPPISYVIVVVEGPDRGKRLVIDAQTPSRVLIGQGPACEFRLTDPHVSRRHAALDLADGRLRLTDLGSTNGTEVAGLAIIDTYLRGEEQIRVGDSTIAVEALEAKGQVPPSKAMRFGRVVGASPEMRRLYPLCERLAMSDVPVILEGETGTGKEQLAEALHEASPRANAPFVVFDCTAVPPNLVESALFGHERGSFTGAVSQRKGVFEQAHKGTLLIDEIGDLELNMQPKLLRAIERGEVQRVGSDKWAKVDVRVLAATRRDLDREVQEGRFRDDLFFRLAVARVELPPLRRRVGDIALLARHFWRQLGGQDQLPDDFLRRLEAYEWPGNVRELYNAVARQIALGELAPAGTKSERPSVPPPAPSSATSLGGAGDAGAGEDWVEKILARDLPFPRARQEVMDRFERRYIERVLAKHGGNVARAAAASGIARRYFQLLRARQPK
jgi:transcriptional regulator with GAF, ATPase, and Fis domain